MSGSDGSGTRRRWRPCWTRARRRCERRTRAKRPSPSGQRRSAQLRARGRNWLAGSAGLHLADLRVLRDLEAIDQFRWTLVENKYPDVKEVSARYREALGRFAANPEEVPAEEAAARVKASMVRDRLVAALDRLLVAEPSERVRAVLQVLDPDPFRDAVKDAFQGEGESGKGGGTGKAAGSAPEQPSGFAAVLGENGAVAVERRRALLVAAAGRRPGDLTLLMALGSTYPINQREGADERLRWYQAAVAVAPANSARPHQPGGCPVGQGGQGRGRSRVSAGHPTRPDLHARPQQPGERPD